MLRQSSKALSADLCHASVDVRKGSRIGSTVHVHLHSSCRNHTNEDSIWGEAIHPQAGVSGMCLHSTCDHAENKPVV